MERSWIYRRSFVFATLAGCFAILFFLTFVGADTRLAETLASGAYLLIGATMGSYVFGSEWADKNKASEILAGITSVPPAGG